MISSLATRDFTFVTPIAGVQLSTAAWTERAQEIFTPELLKLLRQLHQRFEPKRQQLLAARAARQARYDAGDLPCYLAPDLNAAAGPWQIAAIPADLTTRRVEITGPVNSSKMVINMLSRNEFGDRADCAMLDFEDSMKPSWSHALEGYFNVIGAARGDLSHSEPGRNPGEEKLYKLDPDDMPVVMVRCRGLHLTAANLRVDGEAISAGLLDLTTSAFHTARLLIARGRTPKFYVPKVEDALEARWWNELFSALESELALETSSIRATFLIETLPAAFQMEEILYELREHAVGLNVGRWDKIFSDIKTLREHKDRVLPDRASIDLSRPWMRDYALRLIRVCHSHGAFALGGMAAFTPGKTPELRQLQTAKVAKDKAWEFEMGHDGCWVSHPYFITVALQAFTSQNQLKCLPPLREAYPDLLPQGGGPRTMAGLRTNVRVGIAYLFGWNQGIGCVAWDNLMEDLATLEISRAQVWQWLRHGVLLDDGPKVTPHLVAQLFEEELARIFDELGNQAEPIGWTRAKEEACTLFLKTEFQEFLASSTELI